MGLFGRKDKTLTHTATNAPRHWPEIKVDPWMAGMETVHYLQVAATLGERLKASGAQLRFHDRHLYDEGVLTLPLVITEGEQRTAVLVYSAPGDQTAGHFAAVRTLLRQRDGWNTVYYAPEPILPARPAPILERLDTPHFGKPEKERPRAEYALWWPAPGDGDVGGSPALAHLDRWFKATDGYGALLFTAFVKDLGLAEKDDDEPRLFGLPRQPVMEPVNGPGELPLYLHASEQEGLWLAFNTKTPAAIRTRLLGLLANLGEGIRAAAKGKNIGRVDGEEGAPLAWWRATREDARRKAAAGGEALRIGRIYDEPPVRRRQAGATTAAERQSTEEGLQPSRALVIVANTAIDAAVDMINGNHAATPVDDLPEPGQPAPPSLFPFLLVHAGGDTYGRVFWDSDPEEALDEAREMLASMDDVRTAAFVCDTFLRIGDERTDAILVRAHTAGDPRSMLMSQSYRPKRKGQAFAVLGNSSIMGRDGPLIAPRETPSGAGPGAEPAADVVACAREALDATIRLITVHDSSGASSVRDHNGPITSPWAHALKGSDRMTYRFAMMTPGQARDSCRQLTSREPEVSAIAFVYDEIILKNGVPKRSLHLIVQARHSPSTFHFIQRYASPRPGTRFETLGTMDVIGTAAPLFAPAASRDAPRATSV